MATFLAQHRGGGLYSEHVSQRAGAVLALASYRLRLSPSTVTLAGVVVGVGSSAALARWSSASALLVGLAGGAWAGSSRTRWTAPTVSSPG